MASSGRQQSASRSAGFVRIPVRVRGQEEAGRVAAEAYAAGAVGLEERAGEGAFTVCLLLYASEALSVNVARAVAAVPGAEVGAPEPLSPEESDWSEGWKEGLAPVVISSRLIVSPWPGKELWIEPGQAFGIGGHASTRLALEWIDMLTLELEAPEPLRVLDVGAGTGVLALAALRLAGAGARAVACDVDPLASRAARANAGANGLAASLGVFTGTLAALAPEESFDLVVGNLLKSEMLPWLGEIARRARTGGRVVLSGLLEGERDEVVAALGAVGLEVCGERGATDDDGERWVSLCAARG